MGSAVLVKGEEAVEGVYGGRTEMAYALRGGAVGERWTVCVAVIFGRLRGGEGVGTDYSRDLVQKATVNVSGKVGRDCCFMDRGGLFGLATS